MYEMTLPKGSHKVRWELTDGDLACALFNIVAQQGSYLPLSFDKANFNNFKNYPFSRIISITSKTQDWPIRRGW